jgi:hypothetical protein
MNAFMELATTVPRYNRLYVCDRSVSTVELISLKPLLHLCLTFFLIYFNQLFIFIHFHVSLSLLDQNINLHFCLESSLTSRTK